MYLKSKINILFLIEETIKRKSSTYKQKLKQKMEKNYG